MKVTAILKGWTDTYWASFAAMSSADQFREALARSREFPKMASLKVATGHMRDAVELQAIRAKPHTIESRIEPRKGYKLVTFEITKQETVK